MKLYHLFSITFVVISTTFAKNIQGINKRDEQANLKSKRAQTSDECKYINSSMFGKDDSYNCCEKVTCKNGHIVNM